MSMRFLATAWMFALCAICAGRGVAQSVPRTIVVPFIYTHHELLVSARINGSGPYSFLLDTDTSPSAIDLSLAKKLHLLDGSNAGTGSGVGSGNIVVFPVKIAFLDVGGVRASDVDALATDLSGLRAGLGRPIAGVLGTSFLNNRVVQIDYACRTVSFLPDAILEPFTVRFRTSESTDNVADDLRVGFRRASATFDTGNAGYSFVTRKGIADLDLSQQAKHGQIAVARGYGGIARETKGVLRSVRIGPLAIGSIPTNFLPSSGDPFDLNIGNRTLDRFIVTFDYQRGLLTLEPPRSCAVNARALR